MESVLPTWTSLEDVRRSLTSTGKRRQNRLRRRSPVSATTRAHRSLRTSDDAGSISWPLRFSALGRPAARPGHRAGQWHRRECGLPMYIAVGALGYGFVFSLGTSAAPLLVLLTVAAAQANPVNGLLLAMAFGVGRGLPFLFIGLFAGALVRLTRVGQWGRAIQLTSGLALLIVTAYYTRAFSALM